MPSFTFSRRYPILGEFMGYVAGGEVVNAAPPVFCAYMGVLAALATTEAGAQVESRPFVHPAVCAFLLLSPADLSEPADDQNLYSVVCGKQDCEHICDCCAKHSADSLWSPST